jgi:hypothetical protein
LQGRASTEQSGGATSLLFRSAAEVLLLLLLLTLSVSGCLGTPAPSASGPPGRATATTPIDSRVDTLPAVQRSVAPPVRLIIPALAINATIERVGVAPDGDLATPARRPWDDVGWYSAGPPPGQVGSAVIAGHLDRPGGYPAVFWNLHRLTAGAQVEVVDAGGRRWLFRVTRVAAYAARAAPLQAIFGDRSGRYLNLITCSGVWIPAEHQTTTRLVVYTVLQQPAPR